MQNEAFIKEQPATTTYRANYLASTNFIVAEYSGATILQK